MASRFESIRVGVRAAAGVAALLLTMMTALAGPAAADPARGTVNGGVEGLAVNVGSGFMSKMRTALITFRLADGTELGVYCVEIQTEIDPEHALVEKNWEDYPNAASPFTTNREKINWVLHNGFPVVDVKNLQGRLAGSGTRLTGGLSTEEAVAATQAAVWHFSDDTDLDREDPVPGARGSARDVLALYDFLTGTANVGIADQPSATLEVSPTELTGTPGQRIGPFTVRTTGAISELTAELPEGVRITDGSGAELDAAKITDGAQLFLDVPAGAPDGAATFQLRAVAQVSSGRLFVGEDYAPDRRTQSVIVAQAQGTELTAATGATWAANVAQVANAGEDLAGTGTSILMPTLAAVGIVGAGVTFLLLLRRRDHV